MVDRFLARSAIRSFLALLLVLGLGIIGFMPAMAAAEEPVQSDLTLEEAIDKSLAVNESLQKASKNVDISEEMRDYRSDQLGEPQGNASGDIPWIRLLSADLEWQISKRNLTAQQDGVVLSTCDKYWDVLKAQEKVRVAELGVRTALLQLQNAQAGNRIGTLADTHLITLNAQYQTAVSTLSSSRNDLDTAYIAFNQQVGFEPDYRPILTSTIEYQPFEINNLEAEISRILANSPSIWSAEQAINLQTYQEDIAFYSGTYTPYEITKLETQQKQLDLASAKKLTEQSTRSLYYQIKTMEDNYTKLQASIKLAEESLRIMKIKFDIGMATVTEVANEEKNLADAKSALFDLACTHEYSKLVFEKPWAASN
jgi:outer membrane protein